MTLEGIRTVGGQQLLIDDRWIRLIKIKEESWLYVIGDCIKIKDSEKTNLNLEDSVVPRLTGTNNSSENCFSNL